MTRLGVFALLQLASILIASPGAHGAITYTLHLSGVDSTIANQISTAVSEAVSIYNANGQFTKALHIYYSSGVPTAQGSYDGTITFGGSRNTRVALHEMGHTLGVGTYSAYWTLMVSGAWQGLATNRVLGGFDGPGSVLKGDTQHIWPYGLNYDTEDGATARIRHVRILQALQCDMGINTCLHPVVGSNLAIRNYQSGMALDAVGNADGSNVIVYRDHVGTNQRWTIAHYGSNQYSIRNMQAGARALDTWSLGTADGTNLALYTYSGARNQLYYITEPQPGVFRITPVISTTQCADAAGTANGANVRTWTYTGASNQLWTIA